ncbi:hypothetical protein HPP92_021355 [Vanilla planifolia]|uniref:Uncharacterized protein n=1 Tax=Vanilla planifolia TaxID=51239 RepID=A0A835UH39_VANPL|nr:hypothetical protein HPP92_021355 [Vanilla planifolia]
MMVHMVEKFLTSEAKSCRFVAKLHIWKSLWLLLLACLSSSKVSCLQLELITIDCLSQYKRIHETKLSQLGMANVDDEENCLYQYKRTDILVISSSKQLERSPAFITR